MKPESVVEVHTPPICPELPPRTDYSHAQLDAMGLQDSLEVTKRAPQLISPCRGPLSLDMNLAPRLAAHSCGQERPGLRRYRPALGREAATCTTTGSLILQVSASKRSPGGEDQQELCII